MINLKTAANRLKLAIQGKPHFVATDKPGTSLGYRRLADRAGTWSARIADGQGGNRLQALGTADDYEPANDQDILSYEQAADRARDIGRAAPVDGITVEQAIAEYDAGSKTRDSRNVSRVRYHLQGSALLSRPVIALSVKELQAWRNGIEASPVTVNRTIRILKAALNQAAKTYELPSRPWHDGLAQLKHKHEANNVILSDDEVRALVAAAYAEDPAFGLLTEVAAVTGARISQIVRLQVRDLIGQQLMMPTSNKGTGNKNSHEPAPITAGLAGKLKQASVGRSPAEPLLVRSKGDAWSAESQDYRLPFERAVDRAGLAGRADKVTSYALRHSSIVRRIGLGVPLREIAALHDTSVVMIERHYSRDIARYGKNLSVGLIEVDVPRDNVVTLAR
jgi:integrase